MSVMKQEICVIDPIYYTTWLEKSARLFQNLKFLKNQTYYIILKQWRWAIYQVMKQETARVSYILCLRNPTYNLNCKNSYNPSVYLTFNSPKVSGDKRTFTEKSSIMIFLFYHLSISDFVTSSPGNSLNKGVIDPEY